MHHFYSVLLAAAILYAAPIVANPLSADRHVGGSSVHFKTVDEGVWPYQIDKFAGGQAQNVRLIVPKSDNGQWI